MANLFEKPSPGDPFRPNASFQSLLVDMVNWWMTRQVQPGIETLRGPDITVRNTDEDGLDQYSVVSLGDIVFDPDISETAFRNDLVFDAAAPEEGKIFLITQEPIAPEGGIGEARISGFSRVRVNFSNANHAFAAPEDDNYDYLVSQPSDGPAAVIWKESGVGTKWAVVSLNVSSTPGLGATTVLCIPDCFGSEYCLTVPRAWLLPNQGECGTVEDGDPPGGTGDPCTGCSDPLNQLCVVFPDVTDGFFCTGCNIFQLPLTVMYPAYPPFNNVLCSWVYESPFLACSNAPGLLAYVVFGASGAANGWNLTVGYSGTIEAQYSAVQAWDCRSALEMTLVNSPLGNICANWPTTITVQPCGASTPPTITFNSGDLCDDAATHIIYGTGFSATAANNLLTLNSGTATCTSVTGTTSMIITFSSPPSAGALTCSITNENGTIELPMQVANVVVCGGTLLQDSFTEASPPVLLTAHTGETTTGYANFDGQMAVNSAGRAVNSSADDDFGFITDTGKTTYEASIKFLIPPVVQDPGLRSFRAYARFADADNCYFAEVLFSASATTASSFGVYQRSFGVNTLRNTGSVSLNQDTEYTCEISNTVGLINFTINGVSAGHSSTALNGHSKIAVHFHSAGFSTTKPYVDDLFVEN